MTNRASSPEMPSKIELRLYWVLRRYESRFLSPKITKPQIKRGGGCPRKRVGMFGGGGGGSLKKSYGLSIWGIGGRPPFFDYIPPARPSTLHRTSRGTGPTTGTGRGSGLAPGNRRDCSDPRCRPEGGGGGLREGWAFWGGCMVLPKIRGALLFPISFYR